MIDVAVSGTDRIESLWARLEVWLDGVVPHVVFGLAPPADEATLAAAEQRLGRALPTPLRRLLAIHNGGKKAIGGWDLLSTEGIVTAYQSIQKYAHEPQRSPGWIPFVDTVSGDRLCLDLNPDPSGTIGQVFMYCHDDDPGRPIAANLQAWLERIVTCVKAGGIVYDTAREEFLPFYGATGFTVAFEAEPPLRLDAAHPAAAIHGPRNVVVQAVESAGPLPTGARLELVEADTVIGVWDLDALRETEDCATEYNVLIEEPAPGLPVAAAATLRLSGLVDDHIVWVHLATDNAEE